MPTRWRRPTGRQHGTWAICLTGERAGSPPGVSVDPLPQLAKSVKGSTTRRVLTRKPRTPNRQIRSLVLCVGLVGSRRIWPAHVGCLVGPDGSRRVQSDRLDDQRMIKQVRRVACSRSRPPSCCGVRLRRRPYRQNRRSPGFGLVEGWESGLPSVALADDWQPRAGGARLLRRRRPARRRQRGLHPVQQPRASALVGRRPPVLPGRRPAAGESWRCCDCPFRVGGH